MKTLKFILQIPFLIIGGFILGLYVFLTVIVFRENPIVMEKIDENKTHMKINYYMWTNLFIKKDNNEKK